MKKFTFEEKTAFSKVAYDLGVKLHYGKIIRKGDLFLYRNIFGDILLHECLYIDVQGDVKYNYNNNEHCVKENKCVCVME